MGVKVIVVEWGINIDDLGKAVTKESFFEFTKCYWQTVVREPLVANWHIPFLCHEMQKVAERVFAGLPKKHDLVINVPPGSTKSTITSIMFPPWCWIRMNSARIIGASYTHNLAMNLSRLSRDIVISEKYQKMYAPTYPDRTINKAPLYKLNKGILYKRIELPKSGLNWADCGNFGINKDSACVVRKAGVSGVITKGLGSVIGCTGNKGEIIPLDAVITGTAYNGCYVALGEADNIGEILGIEEDNMQHTPLPPVCCSGHPILNQWGPPLIDQKNFQVISFSNGIATIYLKPKDFHTQLLYYNLQNHHHADYLGVQIRQDQATKSYFVNTAGGSRYAVGVGGSVIGMHGHFLLVDDPLDPESAISEIELQTANRWLIETLQQRKVDKAVSPTILIMQRLHQNDPTDTLLRKSTKVRHICLPAEESEHIKPKYLKKFYKEGLFDRHRLGRKVLNEVKMVGQYGFSGQFMQWPVPLGGGMFKTDRIKIEDKMLVGGWVKILRYWDKAGTPDKPGVRAAYTAGVKMGRHDDGGGLYSFWVLDVIRGRWDSAERERIIQQTAAIDGKHVRVYVEQEPGSGGKESAEGTIKRLAGYRVFADAPRGDKVLRADPYSVQVNAGNVYLVRGGWCGVYLDELRFFPLSTYKDQVDASSGAFAKCAEGRIRVGGWK